MDTAIMDSYQITFETWDKLAERYQETFMDLDLYNDTYDAFCQLITKEGADIFEIGCGPGNITRYLLSHRPDFRIKAIDVSPNMVRLARINNPGADFSVMDCRKLDAVTTQFDAIICGFCVPFLSPKDCARLISDCRSLLRDGGIFYLSTIEGKEDQSGYETSSDGHHKAYVYYHPEDKLKATLEANGFVLVGLFCKDYTKKDGTPSRHLIFIASKNGANSLLDSTSLGIR